MRALRWLAVTALTACFMPPTPATPAVALETPFEASATAWADQPGDGLVEGSALLRTRGGEVRTCAALDAALIPASDHARERMARLYGSVRGGFNPAGRAGRHPRFEPDPSGFYRTVRTTKCDAQGRFEFEGIADGEWYVEAIVTWEAPGAGLQGGSLMRIVQVESGKPTKVVLTH